MKENFSLNIKLNEEEGKRLLGGYVPKNIMTDKWFVYFDEGSLHFHHSSTGIRIYKVQVELGSDGGVELTTVEANRDPKLWKLNTSQDISTLTSLIKLYSNTQ